MGLGKNCKWIKNYFKLWYVVGLAVTGASIFSSYFLVMLIHFSGYDWQPYWSMLQLVVTLMYWYSQQIVWSQETKFLLYIHFCVHLVCGTFCILQEVYLCYCKYTCWRSHCFQTRFNFKWVCKITQLRLVISIVQWRGICCITWPLQAITSVRRMIFTEYPIIHQSEVTKW